MSCEVQLFVALVKRRLRNRRALCEPQSANFAAVARHCEAPLADLASGTAICEPESGVLWR